MVRDAQNVSWTYELESERDLLVYVRQPMPGAGLTLLLPGGMTGAILDAETGDEVEPVHIEAAGHSRLEIPAGRTVAVALSRATPAPR